MQKNGKTAPIIIAQNIDFVNIPWLPLQKHVFYVQKVLIFDPREGILKSGT